MYKTINAGSKKYSWMVMLLLIALMSACSGPPKVDWELSISGDVETPKSFAYQELAEMEQVDLSDILMEKSRGEDEVHSFSGVSIDNLLKAAGAPQNYSTLTAKASDGYTVEISKDELAGGIVALRQDGEWITNVDPDSGPIRLVLPETPANRWVFQISELVVNQ